MNSNGPVRYVTIHVQDWRNAASLHVFRLLPHRLQSSEI